MSSPTVLICDDEPMVCAVLTRMAMREGLVPISDTACNTVEMAKRHRPAVILLDIVQPTSGLDLLFRLRSDRETRDVPVVMITGNGDEATRKRALMLGAAAVQSKPFADGFMHHVAMIAHARKQHLTAKAATNTLR